MALMVLLPMQNFLYINTLSSNAQTQITDNAALVDTDDEIIAIINASPSTQIGVPAGGTGAGTFAINGVLYGNTTGALGVTAIGAEGQILRAGASPFVPAWTTATFPATTIANQILYSSATNVVGGISSGNSGVLITSAAGVPEISTDIPTAVTIGSAYIYRVGGTDVADADLVDDITVTSTNLITGVGVTSTDLVSINQTADSDGIIIAGYDDKKCFNFLF